MTPKSLLADIALPASAVAKKSSLPIIECLHINKGRITGTDLERQISAAVDLDLSCCVPADRFQAALKALPPDCELKLDMQEQRLRVRGGRSKFMIPTLPIDDFPSQEWVEPDVVVENPSDVAAAIRTVEPAMALHDVRYYLIGIGVQDGALNATNGHWMAKHDCKSLPDGIIIPRSSVPMLLTALDEETVRYGVNDRGLHIAANGYRLSTKLIEGKFPDCGLYWRKRGYAQTWTVDREEFAAAASSVNDGRPKSKFSGAMVKVADGAMTFEYAQAGEEAQSQISCDGPAYECAFDLEYLVAAAKTIGGERLTLSSDLGDGRSELCLTGDDPAQRVVIMPVRV